MTGFVWRFERMERGGIIQGYTLKQNRERTPEAACGAIIFVYRHDRMRGEEVLKSLRDL